MFFNSSEISLLHWWEIPHFGEENDVLKWTEQIIVSDRLSHFCVCNGKMKMQNRWGYDSEYLLTPTIDYLQSWWHKYLRWCKQSGSTFESPPKVYTLCCVKGYILKSCYCCQSNLSVSSVQMLYLQSRIKGEL